MQWSNTADRYGFLGRLLHWLVVVAIVTQYLLAEIAEESDGAATEPLSAAGIHGALGVTILALAALRVVWRLVELPPARPLAMKSYEIALARAAHLAFYVLLFAIPLSGWALATASDQSLNFLGWFELPQFQPVTQVPLPWIEGGTLSRHQLEELHEVLFDILVGLSLLHVVAALKHQFVDRDNVLRTMLPWRQRGRGPRA